MKRIALLVLLIAACLGLCDQAMSQSAPAASAPSKPAGGTVILNAASYWRHFLVDRKPLAGAGKELVEVPKTGVDTALPPAGWPEPDFADQNWIRMRGPFFRTTRGHAYVPAVDDKGCVNYDLGSPAMALLCARGRFTVTDPKTAGDLTLSLAYRGGVVVYLNGKEVARGHMADPDHKGLEALADDYPVEAAETADQKPIGIGPDATKNLDRLEKRIRGLADIRIPADRLRAGVNILALEIHRAPFPRGGEKFLNWVPMGLVSLDLRAAGAGITPNVDRPKGVQVWAQCPSQRVYVDEYGTANEPVDAVRLFGARNGFFAGEIVVSSSDAIKGLKVEPSDLAAGTIPAASVQVRYALPDGKPGGMVQYDGGGGFPDCFDTLDTAAPADVAAPKGASGPIQPVWLTVHVPRDAKPGSYKGKVVVKVEGAAPAEIPVELSVADWTVPDPKDFQTQVGLVESPESVALRYGVEPWSEKHWQLLDQVFALLGEVGADDVYLLLQRKLHFGNEQSMVRWIKKDDGTYTHDFSIIEKYLDLAVKHLGKPPVVCLVASDKSDGSRYFGSTNPTALVAASHGALFTVLDPKTGKLEEAEGPKFGTPEARAFWKPVFDGIAQRLKDRGLEKSMMHGVIGDMLPTQEVWDDLAAVAPGTRWVMQRHPEPRGGMFGKPMLEQLGAYAYVYVGGIASDPTANRLYGWQAQSRRSVFARDIWDHTFQGYYRTELEKCLVKGYRGFSRMGADFWDVVKGNRSQFGGGSICNRYLDNDWMQTSITVAARRVLAAGKDGPLSTVRLEMFRSGAQECEARIAIEQALVDPAQRAKLGDALAKRCQDALDTRQIELFAFNQSWWTYSGWRWEERSAELFSLAGDVAKATAK